MDSLEARLKFIEVIKTLHKTLNVSRDTSPSTGQSSGTDPVHFYLLHYEDHYEDFHNCLFETTASMDPLDRLNVLIYWSRLLSSLWPRCLKEVDGQYNTAGKVVHNYLLKDLNKMVYLVMPEEGWKALCNLEIVVDVFLHLRKMIGLEDVSALKQLTCQKNRFALCADLQRKIADKDLSIDWYAPNPDTTETMEDTLQLLVDRRTKAIFLQRYYRQHGTIQLPSSTGASTTLHRMENDRERHKKSKEHLWFTERDQSMLETVEFDTLWEQNRNGMTRDDYQDVKRLQHIAQESYLYQI